MIGVVDVGGGMRGVYGAGVFDYCMEHDISFYYCAGVSAGSANVSAYAADQRGRNYRYYTNYAFRPEYMSLRNFITKGSYLDLDYVYGELSNSDGEDPLDFKMMVRSGKKLVIVTTDAETGEAVYFGIGDMAQDDYAPVKGSSCVPVICKPYPVKGRLMLDGGMSDSIPLRFMNAKGHEKNVVVLTRPRDYIKGASNTVIPGLLMSRYPAMLDAMNNRHAMYRCQREYVFAQEAAGRAFVICPDAALDMKHTEHDPVKLKAAYDEGRRVMLRELERLRQFIE